MHVHVHSADKQAVRKEESSTEAMPPALNSADISEYLQEEVSKETIELLSNKNMAEAIHEFVDKMEGDSVST